jgi:hypothetical protein
MTSKRTVFDQQTRNSRQKKAGLSAMRVAKVERRVRNRMKMRYAQAGVFTGIAALEEEVGQDLLRRANAYRKDGTMLTAVHIAQALMEPGCLAAHYLRCRRVGGITLPQPTGQKKMK